MRSGVKGFCFCKQIKSIFSLNRSSLAAGPLLFLGIFIAAGPALSMPIQSLQTEELMWHMAKTSFLHRTTQYSTEQAQHYAAKRPTSCEAKYYRHFASKPILLKNHVDRVFESIPKNSTQKVEEHGEIVDRIQDPRVLRIFNQAKEDVLEVLKNDIHFRWDRDMHLTWMFRLQALNIYWSTLPMDAHHETLDPEDGLPMILETSRVAIGKGIGSRFSDATLYFILAHEVAHAIQEIPRSLIACAASSRSRSVADVAYYAPMELRQLKRQNPGQVNKTKVLQFNRLLNNLMQSAALEGRRLRPGERAELAAAFKAASGSTLPMHANVAIAETTADYLATQAMVKRIRLTTSNTDLQRQFVWDMMAFFPPSPGPQEANVQGIIDPHSDSEHRMFSIVFANRDVQQIMGCSFADPMTAPYDCAQPDALQSLRLAVDRLW